MALPSSGAISLSQVNSELGKSATAAITMNDSAVRSLAGVSSGAIAMSNLHGKSSVVAPTISASPTSMTNTSGTTTRYVNLTLGGTSPSTSGTWVSAIYSGYARITVTKVSTTQWGFKKTDDGYGEIHGGTYRFTATNSAGSKTVDVAIRFNDTQVNASCFTGDSLVTMADGSYKRIDQIAVGEQVRTAVGIATVTQIDLPKLGDRPLVVMADGKCKTSAEHSLWSRNPSNGQQWWATRDIEQWRYEAANGFGPSFAGHEPFDLTDQEGLLWDFATSDGWQKTTWFKQPAPEDTQLYHLLLDEGGSYFVDDYLVSSIADTGGVDWESFVWHPFR